MVTRPFPRRKVYPHRSWAVLLGSIVVVPLASGCGGSSSGEASKTDVPQGVAQAAPSTPRPSVKSKRKVDTSSRRDHQKTIAPTSQ